MPTSPILKMLHLVQNQFQKEVLVNEAMNILERAIAGAAEHDLEGSTEYSLGDQGMRDAVIQFVGDLDGDCDVLIPPVSKFYMFRNLTTGDHTVSVMVPNEDPLELWQGEWMWVYCDGVNVMNFLSQLRGNEHVFSVADLAVPAQEDEEFNLPGFINRGLAFRITVQETTGDPTAPYHLTIYDQDDFQDEHIIYRVEDIDPAEPFVDYRAIWLQDRDLTRTLHLKIENTDAAEAGSYDVTIELERFA